VRIAGRGRCWRGEDGAGVRACGVSERAGERPRWAEQGRRADMWGCGVRERRAARGLGRCWAGGTRKRAVVAGLATGLLYWAGRKEQEKAERLDGLKTGFPIFWFSFLFCF
jgi:hypothetical protein